VVRYGRRARMSKYTPLTEWLRRQTEDSVELTFSEVERIIGDKLPPSARKYKSGRHCLRWWDNEWGAPESDARLAADFETVMVDLENETVRLRRIRGV